jgi:hypothetical protein
MPRFTVTMGRQAQEQLADIWLRATDREAVTRASHRIETGLARNPEDMGESRGDSHRICFVPPLSVLFEIREPDRVVEIVSFRETGPQS